MGFFFLQDEKPEVARKAAKTTGGYTKEFLEQKRCAVCQLNKKPDVQSPCMEPLGTNTPLIYALGGAPSFKADEADRPFAGHAEDVLRLRIPKRWWPSIRWNNTINCMTPLGRDPSHIETACCRPFVVEDIEKTKPDAIFGFGNVALHWAIGQKGIIRWTGRRIPIQVGTHKCWFYPFDDPADVYHFRKFQPRNPDSYPSEMEYTFAKHLERALRDVARGLPEPHVHTVDYALENITCIRGDGHGDLDRVLDFLDRTDEDGLWVGMDYEANALRPYNKNTKLLTCSLAMEDECIAFALDHRQSGWSPKERAKLDAEFKRWLLKSRCRKISFSTYEMEWSAVKFDKRCLRSSKWGDAQSQAYLLDGRHGMLNLDTLCLQYFGFNLKAISNVDRERLDETPLDEVLRYNGLDAKYHLRLYAEQAERIESDGLQEVYEQQMRRVPTMILTQMLGVPIDQDKVNEFYKKYSDRCKSIEKELDRIPICEQFKNAGKPYRPMAEKDVKAAFKELGINLESNDEKALRKLFDESDDPLEQTDVGELARLTIEWRKANKVLSTYIEPVRKGSETCKLHDDDMLHPIMALHKTTTWRTSSEDINIQNYPKRDGETKEVRAVVNPAIIKSSSPIKVVSLDYAGIQARNVAMESLDKTLIKFFHDRYDIHKDWMLRIAKRCPYWADGKKLANDKAYAKSKRHEAKNKFVFPTFFGAHFTTLANKHLMIDERDAEWLQGEFKGLFGGIARWHEKVHKQYLRDGFVTGLAKFRRYAPVDMNERINAPIQADEALIVTDAMNRLSEMEEPQFQATLEIHDDLTFLWPKNKIDEYAQVVIEKMLYVPFEWAHVVPIEVEMSVGDDWASLQEVGAYASDTWKKAA